MTEQELLDALSKADRAYAEAKGKLAKAKRAWVDAETVVIETKLARDRLREELRVYRNTTPNYAPNARELEIEGFRERNPGMVEYARQRDGIEEDE